MTMDNMVGSGESKRFTGGGWPPIAAVPATTIPTNVLASGVRNPITSDVPLKIATAPTMFARTVPCSVSAK